MNHYAHHNRWPRFHLFICPLMKSFRSWCSGRKNKEMPLIHSEIKIPIRRANIKKAFFAESLQGQELMGRRFNISFHRRRNQRHNYILETLPLQVTRIHNNKKKSFKRGFLREKRWDLSFTASCFKGFLSSPQSTICIDMKAGDQTFAREKDLNRISRANDKSQRKNGSFFRVECYNAKVIRNDCVCDL